MNILIWGGLGNLRFLQVGIDMKEGAEVCGLITKMTTMKTDSKILMMTTKQIIIINKYYYNNQHHGR